MEREINISIKDKIAVADKSVLYICGNSDFVINFAFDEEWEAHITKTARFIFNDSFIDVVFEGNQCAVPVISNTYNIQVGVFAGNLRTSTPAHISAKKSILCGTNPPADPAPDAYAQMVELINKKFDKTGGTVDGDIVFSSGKIKGLENAEADDEAVPFGQMENKLKYYPTLLVGEELPSDANLNTYSASVGVYYFTGDTSSLKNTPEGLTAPFKLTVSRVCSLSDRVQEILEVKTGIRYCRYGTGLIYVSWNEWTST